MSRSTHPSRLGGTLTRWYRAIRALSGREFIAKKPLSRRLRLETLEDRTVPTSHLLINLTGPGSAILGTDVLYKLTITDNGTSNASSVTLNDTIPTQTSLLTQTQVSGPSFSYSYSSGTLTYTVGTLAAGTTAEFDINVQVASSGVSNGTSMSNSLSASQSGFNPAPTIATNDPTEALTQNPISITNPGTQSSSEGSTASLSISASDSISGTTLTYAASSLPTGLNINASTGAITGTVALGDGANSPFSSAITVSDGTYSNSIQFNWDVSNSITLTNPGNQTNCEGDTVSLSLSASDSSGTLSYAASGLPAGLKINPSTGAITGTVATSTSAGGPYSVSVTAEDGTYSDSQNFTWTITSPITITNPGGQTNNESDTISLSISASDGSSGTLHYAAGGLPAGLKINTSTGVISGTVAIGDAAAGPYGVTVTASDNTYSASQTFAWTINGKVTITNPGDQTNNEGATISLSISAGDSSGGTLTYGAVGLPAGLGINASTGAITGTVSTGDAAISPFSVKVFAADNTYSAQTDFTWNVTSPVTITNPGGQSNSTGSSISLPVGATGSGSLTFSATSLPTGLTINSTTGMITGTATAAGSFSSSVSVTNGSHSASAISAGPLEEPSRSPIPAIKPPTLATSLLYKSLPPTPRQGRSATPLPAYPPA